MLRRYGYIPSPPDPSDRSARAHLLKAAPPPPEADAHMLPFVSIRDQGSTSSCVWMAIAQAIHLYLASRGIDSKFWLSVLFGYWNTLQQQGTVVDLGCIPRVALQVLSDAGFCNESYWPFVESKVLNQPLPDAYTAALDQRQVPPGYYALMSTGDELLNDIRTAIHQGYPVIYASNVDAAYEAYTGGLMGPPSGSPVGAHQRCLVAYDANSFTEVNSWGTGWGEGGLARFSPEAITWDGMQDFWVLSLVTVPSS